MGRGIHVIKRGGEDKRVRRIRGVRNAAGAVEGGLGISEAEFVGFERRAEIERRGGRGEEAEAVVNGVLNSTRH